MVNIAVIGMGKISDIYLNNITNIFREIQVIGICDVISENAEKAREKYNIPKIYNDMDDVFTDPDVDIVLNLTRPIDHFKVISAALKAGKHVYSEKPLAATFEEGLELVKLAEEKGLLLGGSPDTFMGAGIQTCRKLIDDGYIGDPIGVACSMICRGFESRHPSPEFYYQHGGGPMMDMGPYYITALVNLLGEVSGVTGVAKKTFPTRTITSEPKYGQIIDVEANTYVTGILKFENGAIGTIFTTFDVYYPIQARFEVYGSKGTLFVPDPNYFGGPVQLLRPEQGEVTEIPLLFGYKENSRGLGLADMANALSTGREYRASYKQTLHVLEILTSFDKSAVIGAYYPLKTKFTRSAAMNNNALLGVVT